MPDHDTGQPQVGWPFGCGRRWVLVMLGLGLGIGNAFGSKAAEIWLAGVDPVVRQAMHAAPSDYDALFATGADWARAAGLVRVFKTSTQFLAKGSDEQLSAMLTSLRQHGIKLAVEGLMLPGGDGCGRGVEGYASPGTIGLIAARVKKLGGELAFIAMDEPLWFGHNFKGTGACRTPIPALAGMLAKSIGDVRAIFPDVQVGDIEPLIAADMTAWQADATQFATEFQAATGHPLAFFHTDIDWPKPYADVLRQLSHSLQQLQIPFGIIYNGSPMDNTDEAWTADAIAHAKTVEVNLGVMPAQAVLQTWMLHPARMLPEQQLGTMTSLVLQYAAATKTAVTR